MSLLLSHSDRGASRLHESRDAHWPLHRAIDLSFLPHPATTATSIMPVEAMSAGGGAASPTKLEAFVSLANVVVG